MSMIIRKVSGMIARLAGWLQIAASYATVFWIFKGRVTIDRSRLKDLKPPFIVLGNHTSSVDPALVQLAIPYHCRFITTNFYFRQPILGMLLRWIGAIPKIQFMPDIRSAREALKVVAQGGIIGIFPEGRRSIDGSCGEIPDSTARFIKKAKVPVVTVKTVGGYFVWPRWAPHWNRGHVETAATILLTAEQLKDMSVEQIQSAVCQSLAYNEYDWNRREKRYYGHPARAEGLHTILHQCPRCQSERSMRSKKSTLYCSVCGNTAFVDKHGFLHPVNSESLVFDSPVLWTAWQRENMLTKLADQSFQIQAAVQELRVANCLAGPYRTCGNGHIILRPAGLNFHGIIDGQQKELFFPLENIPTISTEFGYDFEIFDNQNAWWVFLTEEQQTVRLENAISSLHKYRHALPFP